MMETKETREKWGTVDAYNDSSSSWHAIGYGCIIIDDVERTFKVSTAADAAPGYNLNRTFALDGTWCWTVNVGYIEMERAGYSASNKCRVYLSNDDLSDVNSMLTEIKLATLKRMVDEALKNEPGACICKGRCKYLGRNLNKEKSIPCYPCGGRRICDEPTDGDEVLLCSIKKHQKALEEALAAKMLNWRGCHGISRSRHKPDAERMFCLNSVEEGRQFCRDHCP